MGRKKSNQTNKNKLKEPDTYCMSSFLVVNEYDAHLSFHCVQLNKGRLRCTEII